MYVYNHVCIYIYTHVYVYISYKSVVCVCIYIYIYNVFIEPHFALCMCTYSNVHKSRDLRAQTAELAMKRMLCKSTPRTACCGAQGF